jgi:hypothetical protein
MTEYTLSHFLRHAGEVLRAAAASDVVLRRRDDEDVVLTAAARQRAMRDALLLLARAVAAAVGDAEGRAALSRVLVAAVPWSSRLSAGERADLLDEVARAGATAAELGTAEPLAGTLDRWRRAARLRAAHRPVSAHETRPVSIPDDVDDPSIEKATGVVELPLRVRWSYPRRTYDLDNVQQLRLVYEQVLSEGTDEDVRRFIDVDKLHAHWDALVLPPRVRRAWAEWFRRRRGVEAAC